MIPLKWKLRLSLATEKTNKVGYGVGWGVDLDSEKEMEASTKQRWRELWREPRWGEVIWDTSLFLQTWW